MILFGSRARKDNLKDSDYDLLIVAERSFTQSEQLKFQALIRKALAVKNILADVIVQQKSSIAMKMNLPGHIVRSAMLEGIRVWADIEFLLSRCSEIDRNYSTIDPRNLTDFGVEVRYLGDFLEPTLKEVQELIEIVEKIRDITLNIFN